MKNIYITMLFTLCLTGAVDAQLTLTMGSGAPVAGDSYIQSEYDSAAVMPRNTGQNQMWNFSNLPAAATPSSITSFSLASAIPSSSLFPGTTLVEVAPDNVFGFMKSVTSPSVGYTALGFMVPQTFTMSYTDPLLIMQFPFTYGTSYSDNFSANMASDQPVAMGTSTGYATYAGAGTGTLVLPGGAVFTNVLQEKTILYSHDHWQAPLSYVDKTTSTSFLYYHASQKEPLLTFMYVTDSLSNVTYHSVSVHKSKSSTVGINEQNINAGFSLFPNPARDRFSVSFTNTQNEEVQLEIYNSAGELVRLESLGREMQVSREIEVGDLPAGIYFVKGSLPGQRSLKRLIVE